MTGDVLRVGAGRPGREQITVLRKTTAGPLQIRRNSSRTYVIPAKAQPHLSSRRFDLALFDVTGLIAQGYDDQHRRTLPLIVETSAKAIKGVRTQRSLSSIGSVAVRQNKSDASTSWRTLTSRQTAHVWLDRRVRALLDKSTKHVGAPTAWNKGLTGKGAKVAVVDTGVDAKHPDLAGKVVASKNFSDSESVTDRFGHGTHVASTIAGSGKASKGKYRGVAPGANLINAKVLDDFGGGSDSQIIAGMEWSVNNGAKVVSLSLGGAPSNGGAPLDKALNRLSERSGALFVVAAGNEGEYGSETVGSPASANRALAVGAVDRKDRLAEFSSTGPRKINGAIKPEITAPGVDIAAARATGADAEDPVGTRYQRMSGTSMATPHVSGAAAILLQQHPRWKPADLRTALMNTAKRNAGLGVHQQGAGRLDVGHAVSTSLSVSVDKLDMGYFRWPNADRAPVSRLISYTNKGKKAVTLDLSANAVDAKGRPVPSQALRTSKPSVTIPAGRQRDIRLFLDSRKLKAAHYGGYLTAKVQGGKEVLNVPIGWYVEPEMYDVTIETIGRDGRPGDGTIDLVDIDNGDYVQRDGGLSQNGKVVLRVPPGRYYLGSILFGRDTDTNVDGESSIVVRPDVDLRRDTTLTLDARKAKPVTVNVEGGPKQKSSHSIGVGFHIKSKSELEGWVVDGILDGTPETKVYATPTAPLNAVPAEFSVNARLQAPLITTKVVGSPTLDVHPRIMLDAPPVKGGHRMVLGRDLALVERDPEVSVYQQAKKAADSGAKAMLMYTNEFPGSFYEYYSGEKDSPIPVITTTRDAAEKLKALQGKGDVELDVVGIHPTPFVYDIAVPTAKRIPDDLSYRFRPKQFAKFDVTFGGGTKVTETGEARNPATPLGNLSSLFLHNIDSPSKRTDYVLADQPVKWSQIVVPYNRGEHIFTTLRELARRHRPGQTGRVRWFHPVVTSTIPASKGLGVFRHGTEMEAQFVGLTDQADRYDDFAADTSKIRLLRDGKVLHTEPAKGFYYPDVPNGPATFRVELDTARKAPFWKFSTEVSSAWTFKSTGGSAREVLPVVLVDYDVPAADERGRVQAGKPIDVVLRTRHQLAASGTGEITKPALWMSYDDGRTWKPVPVRVHGENIYRATITHPEGMAGRTPSLKLDAKDSKGNRLQQKVIRAYGISK